MLNAIKLCLGHLTWRVIKTLGKHVSTALFEGPSSAETLVVNSKQGHQKGVRNNHQNGEPSNPFVYCRGGHFSDSCDTIDNRRCQLVSQGRCFICLKVDHIYKQCPSTQSRSCYHCKRIGHHHCCLCHNQMAESTGLEPVHLLPICQLA